MKILNWKGYRAIAWIEQALLAIFVILAAVQGNWLNALALASFLIASFVFVIRDDKLPTFLIWEKKSVHPKTPLSYSPPTQIISKIKPDSYNICGVT